MSEFCGAALVSLCLIPGLLLRYSPFTSMVDRRRKRLLLALYIAASVVNTLVLTAMLRLWGVREAYSYLKINGVVFTLITMGINLLVIRGMWREHLFVYGVVLSCNYLLLGFTVYLITLLRELEQYWALILTAVSYLLLLLLTYAPMRTLLRNTVEPFLDLENGDYWKAIWFLPVAQFLGMLISPGGGQIVDSIRQLFSRGLYVSVTILICLNVAASHKHLREKQIMEKQLTAQKLHYADLRARVEDARKARHDFKHHVAVIRHYMDMDDKDGLRSYCDNLVRRNQSQYNIPYTGNIAADGVLYHYMQLAEQHQIRFTYAGTIRSHGIADIDVSALLGNALDNALAGCLTIQEGRSIAVMSHSEKHLLSVAVHNTFDGKVMQSDDALLSRKRGSSPGLGISSMRSICERYGGSAEFQWDNSSFTVTFLLPLTEQE